MEKIIGVTQLQRRFREILDEVVKRRTPYILTRGSRPEAVMISYEHYRRFAELDEAGIVKRFEKVLTYMENANVDYSEKEVEQDLNGSVARTRKLKRNGSGRR